MHAHTHILTSSHTNTPIHHHTYTHPHTHQLLRSLNVRELLKCAWMKDGWKQAPSVQRHTLHFNRLAAWVGCEILLAANADVRLKVCMCVTRISNFTVLQFGPGVFFTFCVCPFCD